MRISEEVKQKSDIVEVVSQYTTLNKAGRLLKGLCPFHTEKHGSFFVYPEQQTWHCFGACATGGDVFSFIMKKEGLDFSEALRRLAERAGIALPECRESSKDQEKENRLYQANAAAAIYYSNLLANSTAAQKARDYVKKRRIEDSAVADFQLGYSPAGWQELTDHLKNNGFNEEELLEAGLAIKSDDGRIHDRFHNMLMFPIVNIKGLVTGFGGRVLDSDKPGQPKYLNSPQTELFDKGAFPYAINLAASEIRKVNAAVIVEGYMDVIAAHQAGYKNVVASMGTSVTERQITALKRLTKNVVFALDADNAGTEATMRGAAFENILDNEIRVVLMPAGKDPDDVLKADPAGWPKLIESAQPLMDFVFDQAAGGLDITTAQGKSLLTSLLLPVIAEMADPVRQAHYIQKLARLVSVSEQRLEAALAKTRQAQRPAGTVAAPVAVESARLIESPLEEYCLSLLIRNPELLEQADELAAECFGCGENREIFTSFKKVRDAARLKDSLPAALHPHLNDVMAIGSVKKTRVDQQYQDYLCGLLKGAPAYQKFAFCILSLKETFLRASTARLNAILDMEKEPESAADEFESLRKQCVENNEKMRYIQIQKQKLSRNLRR